MSEKKHPTEKDIEDFLKRESGRPLKEAPEFSALGTFRFEEIGERKGYAKMPDGSKVYKVHHVLRDKHFGLISIQHRALSLVAGIILSTDEMIELCHAWDTGKAQMEKEYKENMEKMFPKN